jgi:hypothetical protein
MASAANVATTARRKSDEGIMAGHVHSTAFEGLDKRSIVINRPNVSWSSTLKRQDGFVLAVPEDYAKPLHRLQRFKTLAECNEARLARGAGRGKPCNQNVGYWRRLSRHH